MTCQIGSFDLEAKLGHNISTKTVGTDMLLIGGVYTRGHGGMQNFVKSLVTEFKYAGRYARFVIPGASADTIQDLSPNSSVFRHVIADEIDAWYAVDEFNYDLVPGRPDICRFSIRLTKIHSSIDK